MSRNLLRDSLLTEEPSCFLNYPRQAALQEEVDISGAIGQCVSAARMCIHAAEIVRDLVPTSHYLALSIHYMTLSGIVL